MFYNIEKEYRKMSKERKFNIFYWVAVAASFIVMIILSKLFNIKSMIISIIVLSLLVTSVIIYLYIDFNRAMKIARIKKDIKVSEKLNAYRNYNDKVHINNLVRILADNNFNTKNDIKLAIEYYNNQRTTKSSESILNWIITASLALASFISAAYNNQVKEFNMNELAEILGIAVGWVIIIKSMESLIKFCFDSFIISKKQIQSEITNNLHYIYLNFNEFKTQLIKNHSQLK